MPDPAIIEMEKVAVAALRDPSRIVLRDIDWQVQAGDFWVIAGLQGSGKSDFLMMTAGLMSPAAGSYRLFAEPMPIFDEARLPTRLRLGLVFDGGRLFDHLTVRENVALPCRYHSNRPRSDIDAEVQRVLDLLGLGPWADSTPGAIGRNWQRRAGLARALILKPEILLVDNPIAGLDLPHMNWWLGMLQELAASGAAILPGPATLVVTAADFRPWKDRAKQFGMVRDNQMVFLGGWEQVTAGGEAMVLELLDPGGANFSNGSPPDE